MSKCVRVVTLAFLFQELLKWSGTSAVEPERMGAGGDGHASEA
jgi:hypothetical protein